VRVRVDRGLDFAAEVIRDTLAALVIDCHRLPGYQPHRKGKVERLHLTIEQTLLCGLPGYTDGPRNAAGKLYGPISDTPAARAAAENAVQAGQVGPMRIERFAALFPDWVAWYNTERPHAGLDGRTPLQAWNDDASAVQRVDAERVRHLLMAGVERTVGKQGVLHNGLAYVAPELHGRGGQVVQVRYMPHDDRSVEVYLDGAHLCTAYPQGQLSDEQVTAFWEHAPAEARRLGAARRRAARRARSELVPLTGSETTAEQARLVPAEQAGGLSRHQRDALLRAVGHRPVGPDRPHRPGAAGRSGRRTGALMPTHFLGLNDAATLATQHFQLTTRIMDT
jgi:putative transposase